MGRQDARTLLYNIRSSVERFNCYFSFVRSFDFVGFFIGPNYCRNGWREFMTFYVGESCRRLLLRSEALKPDTGSLFKN